MDFNSTIKSNLDKTNSINFGISNTEVVIDILTSKLYSSPVYTTCQELLSNALDSTLERSKYLKVSECSGTSNPSRIKISLPGVFSNKLVIRDYGLGLSEEDLCSKYTQIGYSSKRSTNDYIGSFGIGRLSPFSFCNSFGVKSYYDGVSYSYLVYKDNGSIRLTHISTISTEEPNGLEVSVAIPSDYISRVSEYVRRLVTFFPEDIRPDIFDYPDDLEIKEHEIYFGSDKSKGFWVEGPEYFSTSEYKEQKRASGFKTRLIKYCESTEFHSNVVCGYIPYKLDKFGSFKFCLFYKVGELKISPSREQISEDSYDLIRKDIELLTIYLDKTKIREIEEILKSRDLFTQNSSPARLYRIWEETNSFFDLIINNPPYLPNDDRIKDLALDGGDEGWEFIDNMLSQAKEYLNPLIPVVGVEGNGNLPASYSFLRLKPENLKLSALFRQKKEIALRIFEIEGKETKASIELFKEIAKVYETDFLGNPTKTNDPLLFKKHEIKEIHTKLMT